MWGRIANIAEQLDANAAKLGDIGNTDDNDVQNNITMAPSSDTDYADEDANGWGGSDGDDLDFDDDEDMGSSGVDASFDDVADEDEEADTVLDNVTPEAIAAPEEEEEASVLAVNTTTSATTVQQPQSPPHSFPEMVSVSAPGKALVAG